MRGHLKAFLLVLSGTALPFQNAFAQLDPKKRQLVEAGYSQLFVEKELVSGYAYYYFNHPELYRKKLTLRLAVAPVYLDTELGLNNIMGSHTDFALGLRGGGYSESHSEIRQGRHYSGESFLGHGGQFYASIYQLLNPQRRVPLFAVARAAVLSSRFSNGTAPGFVLPENQLNYAFRTGLRWGGRPPPLFPEQAMELSLWYERVIRTRHGPYGFNGDRFLNPGSDLLWGRALIAYTLPESRHYFSFSFTCGTSKDADRFSAFRLGGHLPLAAEFPLDIPGYVFKELSATRFATLSEYYSVPFDSKKRWALAVFGSQAVMDYLAGFEYSDHWHSGLGGGLTYTSAKKAWQFILTYAYGFNALHNGERGEHGAGFLVQYDILAP